jgi:DNA repair protein RadD
VLPLRRNGAKRKCLARVSSELRDYQALAIEMIRVEMRAGHKKILLQMPTGAGKTVVFCHIIKSAVQKNKRVMALVRGRLLVSQMSKRLFREGVSHGTLLAGHWNFKSHYPVTACSIDTLISRKLRPRADIIVIDEIHMATSDSYKKIIEDYPEAVIVGVTATPYCKKSLLHVASTIVKPISMTQLVEQGYLVPARYFAPYQPDLTGVEVSRSTGDYKQDQLGRAMEKRSIVGDIVTHWKRLAENRPTLCFAVNIEHAKMIVEIFNAAGVGAEHHDADSSDEERDAAIKRLVTGETRIISNVGIFCTGVDIPAVGCIVMARPTKSYNLHIQVLGRGTRAAPGKEDFLVLDHAGNVLEHGFISDEPAASLAGMITVSKPKIFTCDFCYAIGEKKVTYKNPCFSCGKFRCAKCEDPSEFAITDALHCARCDWHPAQALPGRRFIESEEGELRELRPQMHAAIGAIEMTRAGQFCEAALAACMSAGTNPWRAFYETKERHGEPTAKLVFFRLCKKFGVNPRESSKRGPARGEPASPCEGVGTGNGDGVSKDWPFK